MATVDEILVEAKAARQHLGELEQALQEEIDDIRFSAFQAGRALTEDENVALNARRAEKAEARAAFVELTFVTLQRLNSADEIKQLSRKMDAINTDLSDDLERLKRIERCTEIASKVANSMAQVASKIADIAT